MGIAPRRIPREALWQMPSRCVDRASTPQRTEHPERVRAPAATKIAGIRSGGCLACMRSHAVPKTGRRTGKNRVQRDWRFHPAGGAGWSRPGRRAGWSHCSRHRKSRRDAMFIEMGSEKPTSSGGATWSGRRRNVGDPSGRGQRPVCRPAGASDLNLGLYYKHFAPPVLWERHGQPVQRTKPLKSLDHFPFNGTPTNLRTSSARSNPQTRIVPSCVPAAS